MIGDKRRRAGRGMMAVLVVGSLSFASEARGGPPAARRVDVADELHGVRVPDPYRWLENESAPEVVSWIRAQNAYFRSRIDGIDLRSRLLRQFDRLLSLPQVTRPSVYGNRYFFRKSGGGRNQPTYHVREGHCRAPGQTIIDPNTWSEDGTVALDWLQPSPDGSLIAYGRSASGSELSTLYVVNVATGQHLPDEIPFTRHCAVAWDATGQGFYYTRYPEPGSVPPGDEFYHRKVYHHRLGGDWRKDPLVVGDLVKKEEALQVSQTSDHQHLLLSRSVSYASNDLYIRPLASDGPFEVIAKGLDGFVGADVLGDRLFLRTNVGAPRYRVVTAPIATPTPEHWRDVIPEQEGVIRDFEIVGGRLIVTVLKDVQSRLYVYDLEGKRLSEIQLPGAGTVGSVSGEPDGQEAFFSFQSHVHPPTTFRYEVASGRLEVLSRMETGVDLDRYVARQVWFASKDGTRVPMFVMHLADTKLNGNNPTVLYGYGGFNVSLFPRFDARLIPWLEAGGVYAVANLRGGGEFGKAWQEAGRREHKQNVYDDFLAAAEKLIQLKYTNPKRLGIYGGSNGGLLVGACMVQRPELFQAVVCAVPLLDMIRYHQFQIARYWVSEYGSSEDPEQFKWLWGYSPYHQVKQSVDYPATLLLTAESDSRVEPMHAYKMAAALQHAQGGRRPILLRVEAKAGHGAGKPISKRVEEQADIWAFFMWQLGLTPS